MSTVHSNESNWERDGGNMSIDAATLAKRALALTVSAVGLALLAVTPAHAGGQTQPDNGCYSQWWTTASQTNCWPATGGYTYKRVNQYQCHVPVIGDTWYKAGPTSVASGTYMRGINSAQCRYSVVYAYTYSY